MKQSNYLSFTLLLLDQEQTTRSQGWKAEFVSLSPVPSHLHPVHPRLHPVALTFILSVSSPPSPPSPSSSAAVLPNPNIFACFAAPLHLFTSQIILQWTFSLSVPHLCICLPSKGTSPPSHMNRYQLKPYSQTYVLGVVVPIDMPNPYNPYK